MSFTTNIRTDPSSNAFLLNLTYHGIGENFDRSSIELKSETVDDCQTGDVIAKKCDIMLTQRNMSKEEPYMIRDEGSKMKNLFNE